MFQPPLSLLMAKRNTPETWPENPALWCCEGKDSGFCCTMLVIPTAQGFKPPGVNVILKKCSTTHYWCSPHYFSVYIYIYIWTVPKCIESYCSSRELLVYCSLLQVDPTNNVQIIVNMCTWYRYFLKIDYIYIYIYVNTSQSFLVELFADDSYFFWSLAIAGRPDLQQMLSTASGRSGQRS